MRSKKINIAKVTYHDGVIHYLYGFTLANIIADFVFTPCYILRLRNSKHFGRSLGIFEIKDLAEAESKLHMLWNVANGS